MFGAISNPLHKILTYRFLTIYGIAMCKDHIDFVFEVGINFLARFSNSGGWTLPSVGILSATMHEIRYEASFRKASLIDKLLFQFVWK